MYLPQAASLPQLLGIERDLFRCRHLVEEVELELAVVGCSVVVPLFCNRGRCAGERSGLSCVGSPAIAARCHRRWALQVRTRRTKR